MAVLVTGARATAVLVTVARATLARGWQATLVLATPE
jgi:hypothetical protein